MSTTTTTGAAARITRVRRPVETMTAEATADAILADIDPDVDPDIDTDIDTDMTP